MEPAIQPECGSPGGAVVFAGVAAGVVAATAAVTGSTAGGAGAGVVGAAATGVAGVADAAVVATAGGAGAGAVVGVAAAAPGVGAATGVADEAGLALVDDGSSTGMPRSRSVPRISRVQAPNRLTAARLKAMQAKARERRLPELIKALSHYGRPLEAAASDLAGKYAAWRTRDATSLPTGTPTNRRCAACNRFVKACHHIIAACFAGHATKVAG